MQITPDCSPAGGFPELGHRGGVIGLREDRPDEAAQKRGPEGAVFARPHV